MPPPFLLNDVSLRRHGYGWAAARAAAVPGRSTAAAPKSKAMAANEDNVTAVMEVLPSGSGARSRAVSLLERAKKTGAPASDLVATALNLHFSAPAGTTDDAGVASSSNASPHTHAAPDSAAATVTPSGLSGVNLKGHKSPPFSKSKKAEAASPSTNSQKYSSAIGDDQAMLPGMKRKRPGAAAATSNKPLAERVRPKKLSDLVGQKAFAADSSLGRLMAEDRFPSTILWGPPGCGKTTIATIVSNSTQRKVVKLSATQAGVKEVRGIVDEAAKRRQFNPYSGTLLFLDEIHRWNKAQQDALLPHVESGLITLLGATTENPSFSLNKALLSRCKVVVIDGLTQDSLVRILKGAMSNPSSVLPNNVDISDDILKSLATISDGDARKALNALELAVEISRASHSPSSNSAIVVTAEIVEEALQRTNLLYDRDGEEHYNIISALHKCMRAGDTDASLYWLARMLESGEDARYVARRLVRFAAEDVGLADPNALLQATAAHRATEKVGMPECDVILAQAVAYLARAPKSTAVYSAYKAAKLLCKEAPADPVPLHIRNAPTGLMKELGYGKNYTYNPEHGYKRGCAEGLSFFPDSLSKDQRKTNIFDEGDVEDGHSLYPFVDLDDGDKKRKSDEQNAP